MPWNEPGGNGKNNDPWNGRKGDGPPALDKMLGDFMKKLNGALSGKKGGGGNSSWQGAGTPHHFGFIFSLIVFVIVLAWFLGGIFIVNPAEQGVILRFGKYYDTMQPGIHWIPRFIDKKYLVDVQKNYSFSIDGDFLTKSSEQADVQLINPDQSKNLVNVELSVQYRISNPEMYLFNVVKPDETIKSVAAAALSDMVGQMKLDDVLTIGQEKLSSGVKERITKVLAPYNAGLEVLAVTLRKVQAPNQVREAFNDVNQADQDKATYIQQAQAYASREVPLAQGVASRILADANAYQQKVILNAKANIAKYQALLTVYKNAPEVTKERMYLETMQNIFQKTSKVLVDVNTSNNLIYLPIDKLLTSVKNTEEVNNVSN
jgi:membrane protease subunit HflK